MKNRLIQGLITCSIFELKNIDCLEYIKTMPDNSVDCIITDPPYQLNNHGGRGGSVCSLQKYNSKEFNALISGYDYEKVLNEFKRISSQGYIFCSEKQIVTILNYFPKPYITTLLVWHKTNAPPFANGTWKSDIEFIVHYRQRSKTFQGGAVVKSKVFAYPFAVFQGHPTVKPISLIERLTKISTNENDIVFDPFMGSGTTGIACMNLKRNFIGCELDTEYFEIAKSRVEKAYYSKNVEIKNDIINLSEYRPRGENQLRFFK